MIPEFAEKLIRLVKTRQLGVHGGFNPVEGVTVWGRGCKTKGMKNSGGREYKEEGFQPPVHKTE